MTVAVRAVSGERLLTHADGVRAVYADAFGGPPRHEGPERADAYLAREGWTQVTRPAPGGAGAAAFPGPRHPARTAAPRPLEPLRPEQ
ncbi:hypothetical protein [Streptomyces sp. NPDC085466]|uniref:hypothetical protein n=1 Tax=Streptomyces sp. NPDC085466 TaxID=3365725 RepID=UPI0037CFC5A7